MARSASDTSEGADVNSVKVQHLGAELTMAGVPCRAVARIQSTRPTPAPMPSPRTPGSLTEDDEEWIKANLDLCAPPARLKEPGADDLENWTGLYVVIWSFACLVVLLLVLT